MTEACPECGREIREERAFCKYCGALLESEPPAAPVQTPSPPLPPAAEPSYPPSGQAVVQAAGATTGRRWLLAVLLAITALGLVGIGILAVKLGQKKPSIPAISFSASAPEVVRGQPVTLEWSASNTESLRLAGDPVPDRGSRAVSPQQTTTYQLVGVGPDGRSESREVTVRVTEAPGAPVIRFRGDRDHIVRGESLTLEWAVDGATRVQIEPGLGTVEANGKRTVSPQRATEYEITADGAGGRARDRFNIRVDALPPRVAVNRPTNPSVSDPTPVPDPPRDLPRIMAFEAAPSASIQQCQWVALRWTVQGASRLSIGDQAISGPSYKLVQPLQTTQYVLKAEGPGGSVSRSVTVSVAPGNRSGCGR
jgi:hypothetical protein